MAKRSLKVLTTHGCNDKGRAVGVGGLDAALKESVKKGLKSADFSVREDRRLPGKNPQNICNRGDRGVGVQLEIPVGLRSMMFRELERSTGKGTTEIFRSFVSALRKVFSDFQESVKSD